MDRIALTVVATLAIAVVLLGLAYSFLTPSPARGFGAAIHHVFLFMDIGIGLWIVLLVIAAVRRRPAGVRITLLFALIGVIANFVTVTVVGLIQSGGAPEFMLWAAQAGVAFLVAAAIVVPLVTRLVPSPRSAGASHH